MTKYGFNIRTRGGQKVDNIVIMAQDYEQAERRLRQMYNQCEIVKRAESSSPETRRDASGADALINLISRHEPVRKSGTQ